MPPKPGSPNDLRAETCGPSAVLRHEPLRQHPRPPARRTHHGSSGGPRRQDREDRLHRPLVPRWLLVRPRLERMGCRSQGAPILEFKDHGTLRVTLQSVTNRKTRFRPPHRHHQRRNPLWPRSTPREPWSSSAEDQRSRVPRFGTGRKRRSAMSSKARDGSWLFRKPVGGRASSTSSPQNSSARRGAGLHFSCPPCSP